MLVSIQQAALLLGISRKTIERAIGSGELRDFQQRPTDADAPLVSPAGMQPVANDLYLIRLKEAARILHITPEAIQVAVAAGLLMPFHEEEPGEDAEESHTKRGPKFFLVELEDTRRYFTQRGTLLRKQPPTEMQLIHGLLDEIEVLKDQLATALKQVALARMQGTGVTVRRDVVGFVAQPYTSSQRPPRVRTTANAATDDANDIRIPDKLRLTLTFENGLMAGHSVRKLLNAHGVRGETARHAWLDKMREARATRRGVLEWSQHRMIEANITPMFRCIDTECDCHDMEGNFREATEDERTFMMQISGLPEPDRAKILKQRESGIRAVTTSKTELAEAVTQTE